MFRLKIQGSSHKWNFPYKKIPYQTAAFQLATIIPVYQLMHSCPQVIKKAHSCFKRSMYGQR